MGGGGGTQVEKGSAAGLWAVKSGLAWWMRKRQHAPRSAKLRSVQRCPAPSHPQAAAIQLARRRLQVTAQASVFLPSWRSHGYIGRQRPIEAPSTGPGKNFALSLRRSFGTILDS